MSPRRFADQTAVGPPPPTLRHVPVRTRADRVARSHTLALAAFRLGGLFLVGAIGWGGLLLTREDPVWWGPLHAFLTGAVLLAISGATQLFSTTWSASPPADRRVGAAQRWLLAVGALGVVVGYTRRSDWLVIAGAILVGFALLALGWMLVDVVRRSLLRRFDWATRFYLLALSCGVVGVTLGAIVGSGGVVGGTFLDVRTTHMHLNLVGLVGFTIVGTLPTLLPTTVRHRMVSGRELRVAFCGCAIAALLMVAGVLAGPAVVGVGTGFAGVSALVVLGGIVVRLGPRRILGAGFASVMITTGALWLVGWALNQTRVLLVVGHRIYATATLIGVIGVALVLFGSLSYLIPVLAGPGERLTANFGRMQAWKWPRVMVANAAAMAVLVGLPAPVAAVIAGAFLADFLVRVGLVVVRGRGTT